MFNRSVSTVNAAYWWANYYEIITNLYIWGLFFSTVPLVVILNSLIDKGIAEKAEEREQLDISVNDNSRLSINNID